jgi:hypothetical protein
MKEYGKIIKLDQKQSNYDDLINMFSTIKNVQIKKSIFSNKTFVYMPNNQRNGHLSGKQVMLNHPFGSSGIIFK